MSMIQLLLRSDGISEHTFFGREIYTSSQIVVEKDSSAFHAAKFAHHCEAETLLISISYESRNQKIEW